MKTSKEAVPSTPKADRISIYDRDRRSMGQLINSERFVSSTKISISVAKFFLTTSFC